MTTTLQDKIYNAQDISFEALDGVAQSWVQDLAAFTEDTTDPSWMSPPLGPGYQGSRTGWFKLRVPYPITLTVNYASFDAQSFVGVFSWDGITAPVLVHYGSTSSTSVALSSGLYLIGFSLLNVLNGWHSSTASSWSDSPSATGYVSSQIGDLMLAFIQLNRHNPVASVTPPAGWSLLTSHDSATAPDGGVSRSLIYYKTTDITDTGTYVFSISPSAGYNLILSSFTGVSGIDSVSYTENGNWAPPTGADLEVSTGTVNVTGGASLLLANFQHSIYNYNAWFSVPAGMHDAGTQSEYWNQQSLGLQYVSATGTYGPFTASLAATAPTGSASDAPYSGAFLLSLAAYPTTIYPDITMTQRLGGMLTLGVMRSGFQKVVTEQFTLGSFLLDSVEQFNMEAEPVSVSFEELFNVSGAARLRTEEPFDLGETLLVKVEELFIIIGTSDAYIGVGSPASPKLGWRQRS